jgi:hypothetical protein
LAGETFHVLAAKRFGMKRFNVYRMKRFAETFRGVVSMPRVKRFKSSADRLRAFRDRQRAARETRARVLAMPVPVSVPVEAPGVVVEAAASVVGPLLEWEGQLLPIERSPAMSEGDYVELSVRWVEGVERLERARRYAVWRYRGYRVGRVASLW